MISFLFFFTVVMADCLSPLKQKNHEREEVKEEADVYAAEYSIDYPENLVDSGARGERYLSARLIVVEMYFVHHLHQFVVGFLSLKIDFAEVCDHF